VSGDHLRRAETVGRADRGDALASPSKYPGLGARQHKADRIVAEVNNGGDMVEATIRMVDPNVSYNKVHASRGKVIRAEPVAALYEQGRIHHVGAFPTLEDQMCTFAPDFYKAARQFGIDPRTVAKMLAFSVPPGYRRSRPPARPKRDRFTGIIDGILAADEGRPRKQRHTHWR